jgi:high-affinity iron transporter
MLPSILLTLREGLEGALVISVLFGTIKKLKRPDLRPVVWSGVFSAVLLSLIIGVLLNQFGAALEGRAEEIFEGVTMIVASIFITTVIFWIYNQSESISDQIQTDLRHAALVGSKKTIFIVAFLSIVREGIELALILVATSFTENGGQILLGAILGLSAAVLLAWALFNSLIKLNLKNFFLFTGILLILFASGLVAHGVHELNEAGVIPHVVEHIWDTNAVLDEKSYLGQILTTLFGYNGNPSLTEFGVYLGYFLVLFSGLRFQRKRLKLATAG